MEMEEELLHTVVVMVMGVVVVQELWVVME